MAEVPDGQALQVPLKKPRAAVKAQLFFNTRPIILEEWGLPPDASNEDIINMALANQDHLFHNAILDLVVDDATAEHKRITTGEYDGPG